MEQGVEKSKKREAEKQVLSSIREYVISVELFRYNIARTLGIHTTDMECLSILFHRGIATPSELGKHTGLTSGGATTAMLDRLENRGLIERRPNPKDRRGTHIAITKETLERIAPLFISLEKAEQALVSGYSEQELRLILNFMSKVTDLWERERENL